MWCDVVWCGTCMSCRPVVHVHAIWVVRELCWHLYELWGTVGVGGGGVWWYVYELQTYFITRIRVGVSVFKLWHSFSLPCLHKCMSVCLCCAGGGIGPFWGDQLSHSLQNLLSLQHLQALHRPGKLVSSLGHIHTQSMCVIEKTAPTRSP